VVVANAERQSQLGIVAAVAAASIAGVLIYRLGYSPCSNQPAHVPMIISIGILVMMEDSFRLIFGGYGLSFAAQSLLPEHRRADPSSSRRRDRTVCVSLVLLGLFGSSPRARVLASGGAHGDRPAMRELRRGSGARALPEFHHRLALGASPAC